MSAQEQKSVLDMLHTFVRKAAHYAEFLCLGSALYALCRVYRRSHRALIALCAGAAYAAADELHQLFVAARTASAADVCVDVLGVLTGVLLTAWLMNLWQRRQKA